MSALMQQHERWQQARQRLWTNAAEPNSVPRSRTVIVARRKPAPPEPPMGAPLNMLKPPSWQFLVRLAVARSPHEVTIEEVLSNSRVRHVCEVRNEAIALVYSHLPVSVTRIGDMFGRDHATIVVSLSKLKPKRLAGTPNGRALAQDEPMAVVE